MARAAGGLAESSGVALTAWVAAADGTVHGHVALVAGVEDADWSRRPDGLAVELAAVSRLFVRPDARGARHGQRLLQTATAFTVEHDLGLVLDVVDERRSAAIGLYERLGWRYVGRRPADWVTPTGVRP